MYRKGRVFDSNVYNSIHGQKGKVIAYNKKIAEQVVIHNLLKLRFFVILGKFVTADLLLFSEIA